MRVLSVWGFMLTAVSVVIALLLSPTYVLIRTQLAAFDQEVLQQTTAEKNFKAAEQVVEQANMTAVQLSEPSVQLTAHEIIAAINEATSAAVRPEVFRVTRADMSIDSVHVQGTADSREALAGFKTALERAPLFDTAVVPISDLARETDLPFAITVTVADIRNE